MKHSHAKAFSLIEVMIAVSVIAILAAIAIPNFLTYRQVSHDNTCIGNKNLICSACGSCLMQTGIVATDLNTLLSAGESRQQFLREEPKCPVGGKYTISYDASSGFSVTCSLDESVHKATQ